MHVLSVEANKALSSSSWLVLICTLAEFCLAESGGPKYSVENVGFPMSLEVEPLAVE